MDSSAFGNHSVYEVLIEAADKESLSVGGGGGHEGRDKAGRCGTAKYSVPFGKDGLGSMAGGADCGSSTCRAAANDEDVTSKTPLDRKFYACIVTRCKRKKYCSGCCYFQK